MSLHFIIDGYNIMKQVFPILGKKVFNDREGFIRFIEEERICGSKNNKITVVFDGRENVFVLRKFSNIEVIFTKGETADEKIKKMVAKSLNKKNLVVITNDNEVKYFAKIQGVKTIGAEEFLEKVKKRKEKFSSGDKKIEADTRLGMEITKELERLWLKKKTE